MWKPTRVEALAFVNEHLKTVNLIRHSLATEAVMKALAVKLGEDEELWGLTGLFHDMDLDIVGPDMSRHGKTTAELLQGREFWPEGIQAILAHNGDVLGVSPTTVLDWALIAGETVTGFIVACTLVHPSKQIAQIRASSVKKRMKEARFAANVRRERISCIENIGIPLGDFLPLALTAMTSVSAEIGLGTPAP